MSIDLAPAAAAATAAPARAGQRAYDPGQPVMVSIASLLPSDSPRGDGENEEHVHLLTEASSPLPAIVVHRDTMRVIDGMHRLRAAQLRGDVDIAVKFFDGEPEDAFALAVKLNVAHGLPLSQADRKKAAGRIVTARPYWSDRRIAANTGLAPGTIAAIRRRSTVQNGQSNVRTGQDERVRPLNGAEGRLRAGEAIAARPDASLREIARCAGISTATAKDVRDRIRRGEDPVLPANAAGRRPGQETASLPVAARGAGRTTRTPAAALGAILPRIRKDPSLRTESGRALLQLLSLHSIGDETKWRRLAQGVPAHRAAALAQAARRCADHWHRLAHELETRSR